MAAADSGEIHLLNLGDDPLQPGLVLHLLLIRELADGDGPVKVLPPLPVLDLGQCRVAFQERDGLGVGVHGSGSRCRPAGRVLGEKQAFPGLPSLPSSFSAFPRWFSPLRIDAQRLTGGGEPPSLLITSSHRQDGSKIPLVSSNGRVISGKG